LFDHVVLNYFSDEDAQQKDLEAQLESLKEMGFTDRQQCLAALRKRRNKVTVSVVEELAQDGGANGVAAV